MIIHHRHHRCCPTPLPYFWEQQEDMKFQEGHIHVTTFIQQVSLQYALQEISSFCKTCIVAQCYNHGFPKTRWRGLCPLLIWHHGMQSPRPAASALNPNFKNLLTRQLCDLLFCWKKQFLCLFLLLSQLLAQLVFRVWPCKHLSSELLSSLPLCSKFSLPCRQGLQYQNT